jgi:hypothetical protein
MLPTGDLGEGAPRRSWRGGAAACYHHIASVLLLHRSPPPLPLHRALRPRRARRPWRRAVAPPPASSAPRPQRSTTPPLLRPPAAWVPEGKRWKVGGGADGAGELRFSAPSQPNGSSHRVSWRILDGSRFFRPFGRAPSFAHGAEPVETLPNAPFVYNNTIAALFDFLVTSILTCIIVSAYCHVM